MTGGAPSGAIPAIRLDGIGKHYGDVLAVDRVDLDVADGEFFSMLGPSGSGKTTTLRLIAGFEQPTRGRVLLHGEDVSGRPPYQRDVNTVFQDYALFPHMDVGQNVGYALMIRKVPGRERDERVQRALEMVRLTGYDRRRPAQLSGGQRQRVALARALVNRPRVLLLDEPLGPVVRTALLAGGLLAFALSFDEIIVTQFTAGTQETIPIWILNHLRQPNQRSIVNVVALGLIVLSTIPVYLANRLASDSSGAAQGRL